MSKGPAKQRASLDNLMRAAWDAHMDLELTYKVRVDIALCPQVQLKGRYTLLLTAYERTDVSDEHKLCSYRREYPNADVGSLEALLFNGLNRLGIQLDALGRAKLEELPF